MMQPDVMMDSFIGWFGEFAGPIGDRLKEIEHHSVIERIWQRDPTVWFSEPVDELTDRLGWLSLPDELSERIRRLTEKVQHLRPSWLEHVVLMGMGGSSLAPEVFEKMFSGKHPRPSFDVLDSTHPEAVRRLEARIQTDRTLFIVASKSGTTLETLSFFRYFWHRVYAKTKRPGEHFVAVTDPKTPLETLARERSFLTVFQAPSDIGGRFSALCEFGLVPILFAGLDPGILIDPLMERVAQCRLPRSRENPAALLGAFIGEAARRGRNRLTIWTPPSWRAFPSWLEQLLAESTGKDGRGIIPVVDEPPVSPACYRKDRAFVIYFDPGTEPPVNPRDVEQLVQLGHPVLQISVPSPARVGAEMFTWELAVAIAGMVLGIHPFNQPDVQLAKALAKQAMKGELEMNDEVQGTFIQDTKVLNRVMSRLKEHIRKGAYLAIQMFLPPSRAIDEAVRKLRQKVVETFGIASTAGYGPRFLHSTGQLHKGGPADGCFIQMIDEPRMNLAVPETDYTFDKLIRAQADGDRMALEQRGRPVVRLIVNGDAHQIFGALTRAMLEIWSES